MEARAKRHPASDMVISSPKPGERFTQMQGMSNSPSLGIIRFPPPTRGVR